MADRRDRLTFGVLCAALGLPRSSIFETVIPCHYGRRGHRPTAEKLSPHTREHEGGEGAGGKGTRGSARRRGVTLSDVPAAAPAPGPALRLEPVPSTDPCACVAGFERAMPLRRSGLQWAYCISRLWLIILRLYISFRRSCHPVRPLDRALARVTASAGPSPHGRPVEGGDRYGGCMVEIAKSVGVSCAGLTRSRVQSGHSRASTQL